MCNKFTVSQLTLLKPSGHYMYRTVVTICTARFNTQQILRSIHTVYLCVLCGSENKQRLFPCKKINLNQMCSLQCTLTFPSHLRLGLQSVLFHLFCCPKFCTDFSFVRWLSPHFILVVLTLFNNLCDTYLKNHGALPSVFFSILLSLSH